jgi:hypothetical protein
MAELNKTGLINGIENLLTARNYTLAKKFVEELLAIDPNEARRGNVRSDDYRNSAITVSAMKRPSCVRRR